MRKIIVGLLVLAMIMVVGCDTAETPSNIPESSSIAESETSASDVSPSTAESEDFDLSECERGDTISIVGQVAASKLMNGDMLWVQVQQDDGSFVIYHCQMKSEFIEAAESLKALNVVKIKGLYLSYVDLGMENTSPVVTLYDCEIE